MCDRNNDERTIVCTESDSKQAGMRATSKHAANSKSEIPSSERILSIGRMQRMQQKRYSTHNNTVINTTHIPPIRGGIYVIVVHARRLTLEISLHNHSQAS
jgi:hypothetical protein